jgi:hypothetical protein
LPPGLVGFFKEQVAIVLNIELGHSLLHGAPLYSHDN